MSKDDMMRDIYKTILIKTCADKMQKSAQSMAAAIAALAPEGDEKYMAETIDKAIAVLRETLPDLVVHYQGVIRRMADKAHSEKSE